MQRVPLHDGGNAQAHQRNQPVAASASAALSALGGGSGGGGKHTASAAGGFVAGAGGASAAAAAAAAAAAGGASRRQGGHFSPRCFAIKHQLMTASIMVHVTNLTPGSDNPTRRTPAGGAGPQAARAAQGTIADNVVAASPTDGMPPPPPPGAANAAAAAASVPATGQIPPAHRWVRTASTTHGGAVQVEFSLPIA
jgi:hypothetical protein